MARDLAALRLQLIEETEDFLNEAFGSHSRLELQGGDQPRDPIAGRASRLRGQREQGPRESRDVEI